MIQNKHIIRLSFIGLFLSIVANIVLYRYFMIEEVVIKQIAEQNQYISQKFKSIVWNKNNKAASKMQNNDYLDLINDSDFIKLAKDINVFFASTNANIAIFNNQGHKVFSSHHKQYSDIKWYRSNNIYNRMLIYMDLYFLTKFFSNQPLNDAYRGKTQHSLVSRAIIITDDNHHDEISFIKSYIPIIDSHNGDFTIQGVLEITTDITAQWDGITYLEQRIFAAFLIVFIIFFIIVMYNTNYAQNIINKQYETNRDLEEAKTRAETESSAKTDFLANISHELRTPLNAIIGFSEIMISETYGKMENKQYLDYIHDINNSGKHLLSVINDILDFSKASADKLQVEKVELDLNKLASSSMRFVKPRADEAKVQLVEKFTKEHIIIKADPKRLKQALLNLLSNSVKFTPENGSVTLSVKKDAIKKTVDITVTDTGIGMSDQDIPKALSSFGQVDNRLSRKYEGTGLGLPLTKKLIELMGGKFDLQSKEGRGTRVTITFEYSDSIDL